MNGVVASYPFHETEAGWLSMHVRRDFEFEGSAQLCKRVIENPIKNALRALRSVLEHQLRELFICV